MQKTQVKPNTFSNEKEKEKILFWNQHKFEWNF